MYLGKVSIFIKIKSYFPSQKKRTVFYLQFSLLPDHMLVIDIVCQHPGCKKGGGHQALCSLQCDTERWDIWHDSIDGRGASEGDVDCGGEKKKKISCDSEKMRYISEIPSLKFFDARILEQTKLNWWSMLYSCICLQREKSNCKTIFFIIYIIHSVLERHI